MRTFSVIRSHRFLVAFAASAALSLLLATSLAAADGDSDGDGVPDAIEQETQRTVAATNTFDELNISSRLASQHVEDQFEVSFKAGTFDVRYEQSGGGTSSYELELRKIIEWVDTIPNGQLDAGEIVANTTLGSSAFGNVPIQRSNTTNADGGHVVSFTVRSNTGEVTLNLTIASRFMRLSKDRVLTPMEVKMDLTLNHVIASTNANIGVELWVDTEAPIQFANHSWDEDNHFAPGEAAMTMTRDPGGRPATVFFSWAKTALADGQPIPVSYTSVRDSEPNSYDLYLAYRLDGVRPVKIVHDPTLGVDSVAYQEIVGRPRLQGDALLYAGSLAGMALLVAATIVIANRRRRKREE